MLSDLLNTNEVKDSAGLEVEYERIDNPAGRATVFAKVNNDYATPCLIKVQHRETGKGTEAIRRSNITITDVVACTSGNNRPCSASLTLQVPVGDMPNQTGAKTVLAKMMSLLASTGADTTIKFDCTGNGAKTLLNGTL